jgi:hypothetical protein
VVQLMSDLKVSSHKEQSTEMRGGRCTGRNACATGIGIARRIPPRYPESCAARVFLALPRKKEGNSLGGTPGSQGGLNPLWVIRGRKQFSCSVLSFFAHRFRFTKQKAEFQVPPKAMTTRGLGQATATHDLPGGCEAPDEARIG